MNLTAPVFARIGNTPIIRVFADENVYCLKNKNI